MNRFWHSLAIWFVMCSSLAFADINATYYDQNGARSQYFTGNEINIIDANINFNWGRGEPLPGMPRDDFSVRWVGELVVPADGNFRFRVRGDDGIRIWVDGNLLVNDWSNHGPRNRDSSPVALLAGQRYSITVEHYERGGGAVAVVSWSGAGISGWEVIPAANLFANNNPPEVLSASYGCSADSITVNFDKTLDPVTAENPANYALNNGATVIGAFLDGSGQSVSLQTSDLVAPTYQVTINNVEDISGNTVAVNSTVSASFSVQGLLGTYYSQNNTTGAYFSGNQVERLDATVDFNWGGGSPVTGIGNDRFSVRWQGDVVADNSANYQFRTRSDDGVRLYIDGNLVVNNWTNHGPTYNASSNIAMTAGQQYSIVMEYFENTGGAVAELEWQSAGFSWQTIPTQNLLGSCGTPPTIDAASFSCSRDNITLQFSEGVEQNSAENPLNYSVNNNVTVNSASLGADNRTVTLNTSSLRRRDHTVTVNNVEDGSGNPIVDDSLVVASLQDSGLTATYYDQNGTRGAYFTGSTVEQAETTIDNDWGTSSPVAGIGVDNFSVRWVGSLQPPSSGSYIFRSRSDDGFRVYLDGNLILNDWSNHGPRYRSSAAQTLVGGRQYAITVEFYEAGGGAVAELEWSGPGIPMQIIGAEYFVSGCDIEPVAQWLMDEPLWNNVSPDVIDNTGNGHTGQAFNGATTAGESCKYGIFDGDNDYVEVPHSNDLNGVEGLTYMAWIRADSWTGVDQIIAKSVHGGGSGRAQMGLFSENGRLKLRAETQSGRYEITTDLTLVAGDWNHVAGVFDGDSLTIYIDGVARAIRSFSDTTLRQTTDPLNISKRVGTNAYYFDGLMDDVRVYTEALSYDEINDIISITTLCPISAGLSHYEISTSGTALTCEPISVTITGHDAGDNPIAPVSGTTIALSTSTGVGVWSNPSGGVLVNNGNGNADFIFDAATAVTLNFNHSSAGPVNLNINAGTSPNEAGDEDPIVTFVDVGFRFIDQNNNAIPTHIAGKTDADQVFLQAIRTDPVTGECANIFADGDTVALSMGAECVAPDTCAGNAITLDYSSNGVATSTELMTVNSAAAPDYSTPIAVQFGSDSTAAFRVVYRDAGQMRLHARYEILDGIDTGINEFVTGSSNIFLVKPAGLCIEAEAMGSNLPDCSGPAANCSVYATVGDSFPLTVSGRTWEADGEENADFCSGISGTNEITSNFQLNTIGLSPIVTLPIGGNNGLLRPSPDALPATPTIIDINSGGTATGNFSIDQVGAFQFTASPSLYFGESIAAASSDHVGRFIPDHYLLTSSAVTPADTSGVTAYTYMGQEFLVEYSLQAVDANNIRMVNYRADNNNLQLDTAAIYSAIDGAAVNLSSRLTAGGATVIWGDSIVTTPDYGELSVTLPMIVSRQLGTNVGAPDGPYQTVNLGLLISDADGVGFSATDLDLDSDGIIGNDSITLGSPGDVRYGRVFVPPMYGPEIPTTSTVPINFVIEFFNNGQFEIHRDDGTTVYDGWAPTCSDGDLSCSLVQLNSAPVVAVVISGRSDRVLAATSTRPGVNGNLNLGLSVDSWLLFDWDNDGLFTESPFALATFGTYRGHDRIIYWREKR